MSATPEGIEKHQADFKISAWEEYEFQELGNWVHLLAKRASHRSNRDKAKKDFCDAQNYLDMMQAKLNAEKSAAGV